MDEENVDTAINWAIEALPFIWGAHSSPDNVEGVPNELPFLLSLDNDTGRVIQEHSPFVAAWLSDVYEKGSILGSNVDDTGAGRRYADDFLNFISGSSNANSAHRKRSILEIGCGNGYLLDRLRDHFDTVIGVEPGPQGQVGAERFGLTILHDFFPSPQLVGQKFSAIVLMSVFEHVEDPVALASMLIDYLEPGGRIFVSVPDEGPYIRNFDVSTLFHEHWSYFERDTLLHTMALGGLNAERSELSGFGGSIYAEFSPATEKAIPSERQLAATIEVAKRYIIGAQASCDQLGAFCHGVQAANRSLGIYVPARFVNAMRISGIPFDRIRFFDDDPSLTGTFYPGIPIGIETRSSLLERPVDTLLIMSRTFGGTLKKTLLDAMPTDSDVVLISDLFDQSQQASND